MPYTPTTWEDEPAVTTPVNAANLNKIEQGVVDATDTAEAAQTAAAAAQATADAAATAQQIEDHRVDTTNVHGIANTAVLAATTASFTTADETKLDGIEALADVTDTTNVAAAGAAMQSVWNPDTLAWSQARPATGYGWIFNGATSISSPTPADVNTKVGDIWMIGPGHA